LPGGSQSERTIIFLSIFKDSYGIIKIELSSFERPKPTAQNGKSGPVGVLGVGDMTLARRSGFRGSGLRVKTAFQNFRTSNL
jgi:hypothetical protein